HPYFRWEGPNPCLPADLRIRLDRRATAASAAAASAAGAVDGPDPASLRRRRQLDPPPPPPPEPGAAGGRDDRKRPRLGGLAALAGELPLGAPPFQQFNLGNSN
ncbi:hypothetical protein HK405_009157, partial [Cladochytrium tenue]